ncbi:MAG TPA: zinc ribbon domain-containing protein [Thermoplasmata archaeon]|nr:zinc ribbon domain-containing protein [Thermoplasmata archaeon]
MFEKREVRFLPGVRREDMWTMAWDWWARQGFQLTKTGPYRFHGASFYARIGLRRESDLIIDEASGGCTIDLSLRATLTQEGLIVGAVAAVLLLPVAVLGGAVSYSEYETDARNLSLAFWQYVSAPPGAPSAGPAPVMPPPCKGCGSALLPDWKVCPYCGRPKDA